MALCLIDKMGGDAVKKMESNRGKEGLEGKINSSITSFSKPSKGINEDLELTFRQNFARRFPSYSVSGKHQIWILVRLMLEEVFP